MNGQRVDQVRPRVAVRISIPEQLLGDGVSLGRITDQDIPELVPRGRRQLEENPAQPLVTLRRCHRFEQIPLKLRTGCSSTPFGAMPVCPWNSSQNPTPTIVTEPFR